MSSNSRFPFQYFYLLRNFKISNWEDLWHPVELNEKFNFKLFREWFPFPTNNPQKNTQKDEQMIFLILKAKKRRRMLEKKKKLDTSSFITPLPLSLSQHSSVIKKGKISSRCYRGRCHYRINIYECKRRGRSQCPGDMKDKFYNFFKFFNGYFTTLYIIYLCVYLKFD